VAYDGYNGGKDDTYVDWTSQHSREKFQEDTMEVTQNYNGVSMMVLKFPLTRNDPISRDYKRNWPSPIVFDDDCKEARTVRAGFDNTDEVDVSQYRIFRYGALQGQV